MTVDITGAITRPIIGIFINIKKRKPITNKNLLFVLKNETEEETLQFSRSKL